jgi:hypothetical protein
MGVPHTGTAMQFFDLDDYTINYTAIAEINREEKDSWELTMLSGNTYTLDGETLKRFKSEFKSWRTKG